VLLSSRLVLAVVSIGIGVAIIMSVAVIGVDVAITTAARSSSIVVGCSRRTTTRRGDYLRIARTAVGAHFGGVTRLYKRNDSVNANKKQKICGGSNRGKCKNGNERKRNC
jgi:hypothetical protein